MTAVRWIHLGEQEVYQRLAGTLVSLHPGPMSFDIQPEGQGNLDLRNTGPRCSSRWNEQGREWQGSQGTIKGPQKVAPSF